MRSTKKIARQIFAAFAAATLLFSLLPTSFAAGGTTYYVSQANGAAGASGSSSYPFKTIAQAIGAMREGDTCIVRDGVYYETLEMDGKNNLTFRAATNGKATISGGTPITSWEKDSTMANVWKTSAAAFTDADGNDRSIIFQDGELCYEARWPNLTTSGRRHPLLLRENYARVDSGSKTTPTIVDDALTTDSAIAGKNLEGASVWSASGVAYWSYIYPIESVSGNTLTLAKNYTYTDSSGVQQTASITEGTGYWPGTNRSQDGKNLYYIFDSKELLDTNGEWYRDRSTGTLYFYDDSGSAPQGVEIRTREYAVNLNNVSGISIEGINIRGAIVNFGETATDCVLKNAKIETVDYLMPREGERSAKGKQPGALGIAIDGSNNLITGCEIFNMYGEGVLLEGTGNRVVNNYIHDINFEHTYSDGVYINGSSHLISHNTIAGLGRGAIGGLFASCEIAYNDMSDGCRLSRDGGIVYLVNNDHLNTEFHHNILHDSVDNEGMQYGLYLDSFTTGMIVYRNLLYNLEANDGHSRRTMDINPNSLGNIFFNNTVANTNPIGGLTPSDRSQTVFVNNLFKSDYLNSAWTDVKDDHNMVSSTCWTNPSAGDYTLLSTAVSVIDWGVPVPGVADEYVGTEPDYGAFEYGETAWTAGHNFSNEEFSKEMIQLNPEIPYRNYVVNGGFETIKQRINGNVTEYLSDAGWTDSARGDIPLLYQRAWTTFGTYAMSGNYSAKLADGQTISQTVTGLKPFTTYTVGGYAQLMGENTATWDGRVPDGYPELTRGNTITGFTTDTVHALRYSSMKFGDKGYDSLEFRLQFTSASTRTGSPDRSVEVWLGNPENGGEKLSEFSVLPSEVPYQPHIWVKKTATFDRNLTGNQEIYILFRGDFYGVAIGCIFFDDSDGADIVTLTAQSDSGDAGSTTFAGRAFESAIRGVEVTTGAEGTVTITLSKSGGTLNGYVDEIRLTEIYNPMNVYFGSIEVMDEEEKPVYAIHKGDMHIVSGELIDRGAEGEFTVTLCGMDDDGTLCQGESTELVLSSTGNPEFSLSARAPLSDNAKFLLTLTNEAGQSVSYPISNEMVLKQSEGESTLILKDFAVRNLEGELLASPAYGALNIFEADLENKSDEVIPLVGFLAIYKDGTLSDLMYLKRTIDVSETGKFWVGTRLPEEGNINIKLFAWNSFADLNPLVESALYEMND